MDILTLASQQQQAFCIYLFFTYEVLLPFKLAICVLANILIICLLYDENLSTYLTEDAITASTVKRLSEDDVHTNEVQTVNSLHICDYAFK